MTDTKIGPIEVWLTQSQSNLGVTCTVVHDDESTEVLDVDSLSMRGAMREITGHYISQDYEPDGRWSTEAMTVTDGPVEAMRRFKPRSAS